MRLLERHDWPGNVRELRNALEHAVAVAPAATLLPQHLPRSFAETKRTTPAPALRPALHRWLTEQLAAGANYEWLEQALEALVLQGLLPRFENKPTLMARELEMNRVTLRRKCRRVFPDLAGGEE